MDAESFVIRPIRNTDFDWLYEMTHLIGAGFTSLPNDKEYIARRIFIAEQSFQAAIPVEERIYLFVRENLASGERIGVCGIHDDVGYKEAFYNYQVSTVTQLSKDLNIFKEHKILNVVNNFQTASELISLWLHPKYRKQGLSKSLSLSRFLFMAQYPDWFGDEIIAEIRGVSDDQGNSPFWEGLGRHFFGMDFKQADRLTVTKGKQYIADLISREPIYLDLLPITAQNVVGVEHPRSTSARHFLESEGFKYNNYIDIFDGGPLLNVERKNIKTIANSKIAKIASCVKKIEQGFNVLMYNTRMEVAITEGKVIIKDNGDVIINDNTAKILDVGPGDQIRFCFI